MNGYESSESVKVVLVDQSKNDAVLREQSIKLYHQQVEDINSKILEAQKHLDDLNQQIGIRQEQVDSIFEDKVKNMQARISGLDDIISVKAAQIQYLDTEIADKTNQSQNIQLDFSTKQTDLDAEKEQNRLRGISLGGIEDDLNQQKANFEKNKVEFEQTKIDFENDYQKRINSLATKELALSNLQITIDQQKSAADYRDHQQDTVNTFLQQREDKLSIDLAAAQLIVNQSVAIENQRQINERRATDLDVQETQLILDTNQIKTTLLALAIQKAELADRQRIIETFEQTKAQGGNT